MFTPWTLATAALLAAWLSPRPADAAPVVVHPGETAVIRDDDSGPATPAGAVLAETVLPFTIELEPEGGAGSFLDFDGTATGTQTSTVVRDGKTGTLSFVYDVDLAGEGDADASEASILTVDGFDGFSTAVTGLLDFESVVLASRTEDGSGVRLTSDDPGLGGAPRLVVRTDAVHFDDSGTARFFAGDELAVLTPDGLAIEFAGGTAVVAGTFAPVDLDTPPPAAIPLPPAAWSGLAALGAMGLARAASRLRRRRTSN